MDHTTLVCKKDTLNSQPVSGSPGLSYPLPLRLCALASLRSFLPTAPGSLREIHDVRGPEAHTTVTEG